MIQGNRNAILTVLMAILLAVIITAFLIPSFYALPSIDDFSNSLSVRAMREQGKNAFELALTLTWNSIMQLGGGPYCFIHFFFAPFAYFGIPGLRITILLVDILFLLSVFALVRCVVVTVLGDRKPLHLIVLYTIAVMSLVGFQYSAQLFSWMTCSLGYLLPISGMLAGVAAYIRGIWEGKRRYLILSVCGGLFGAWGTVQISALTCGLYLLAYLILMNRSAFPRMKLLLPLLMLVLAISCLLAPGLYIRKAELGLSHTVMKATLLSLRSSAGSMMRLIRSPFSLSVVCLLLLAARWLRSAIPVKPVKLLWTGGFLLLAPMITAFPIQFCGYNGLPDRALFVTDLASTIGISAFLVSLIAVLKSRGRCAIPEKTAILPWGLALLFLCMNILVTAPPTQYATATILKQWSSGQLQEVSDYWTQKISLMDQSAGQDLVLDTENFPSSSFIFPPCMADYPNNPNNVNIAEFYHLHSFTATHSVGGA